MPDWLRALLGDVTAQELALVGVVFTLILLFSWAPRIGEAHSGGNATEPPLATHATRSDAIDPGATDARPQPARQQLSGAHAGGARASPPARDASAEAARHSAHTAGGSASSEACTERPRRGRLRGVRKGRCESRHRGRGPGICSVQ